MVRERWTPQVSSLRGSRLQGTGDKLGTEQKSPCARSVLGVGLLSPTPTRALGGRILQWLLLGCEDAEDAALGCVCSSAGAAGPARSAIPLLLIDTTLSFGALNRSRKHLIPQIAASLSSAVPPPQVTGVCFQGQPGGRSHPCLWLKPFVSIKQRVSVAGESRWSRPRFGLAPAVVHSA